MAHSEREHHSEDTRSRPGFARRLGVGCLPVVLFLGLGCGLLEAAKSNSQAANTFCRKLCAVYLSPDDEDYAVVLGKLGNNVHISNFGGEFALGGQILGRYAHLRISSNKGRVWFGE